MNPLLSLLALCGFWTHTARWLRLDAAPALLLAVAAMLAVLYTGGLLGVLDATVWGLRGLGLVAGVLAVTAWWRQPERSLPSPAVVVPIVLVLAFWALHHDASYFYYDEFGHWGIYLRDMLAAGEFWGAETNARHPQYVPGGPLWQYFFVQGASTVRPDGLAYLAQFVLLISPLSLLWHRLGWPDWPWVLGLLVVLMLGLAAFTPGITSLYVDHLLSAWFVGALLLHWHLAGGPRRRLALLALPLLVLGLLKSVGLPLAVAAVGMMAIQELFSGQPAEPGPVRPWIRRFGLLTAASVLVLLPTVVAVLAWHGQRDALGVRSSSGSVAEIVTRAPALPTADREALVAEIDRRYGEVLLHQQLGKEAQSWNYNSFTYALRPLFTDSHRLSYVGLCVVVALLWLVAVIVVVPPALRKRALWLGLGLAVVSSGFAVMLWVTYRGGGEYSLLLSSVLRYLHTLALPLFLLVFVLLTPGFARARMSQPVASPAAAALFASALALYAFNEPPYLRPLFVSRDYLPLRAQTDAVTAQLRALAGDGKIWVFLPNDSPNEFMGRFLQFQLSPVPASIERSPEFWSASGDQIASALGGYAVLWFPVGGFVIAGAEPLLGTDAPAGVYLRGPEGGFELQAAAEE